MVYHLTSFHELLQLNQNFKQLQVSRDDQIFDFDL